MPKTKNTATSDTISGRSLLATFACWDILCALTDFTLLGFIGYMAFNRIPNLAEHSSSFAEFSGKLGADMSGWSVIWIAFWIVLVIWFIGRVIKASRERVEKNAMFTLLKEHQVQSKQQHGEFMTALKENTEAIIKAMREPMDGRE